MPPKLDGATLLQFESAEYAGDPATYYNILAQNGHDYGNLAFEAATNSGFYGEYANNYVEAKAQEFGFSYNREQIMRDLMEADFVGRSLSQGEALTAARIAEYHREVF